MRRSRCHGWICVWLAASLVSGACQAPAPVAPAPPPPAPMAPAPSAAASAAPAASAGRASIPIDATATAGSLVIDLPDPRVASPRTAPQPLSPADAAALLARMEPPPVFDNRGAPPLRAPTARPPHGPVAPIAFQITAGRTAPDGTPRAPAPPPPPPPPPHALTPPQITPQGEVARESEVRIRFDEPMVPVAAVGTAVAPAVTIAPAIVGEWRWLDTRVLVLHPVAPRLPQATAFTVTVPAGTRADSGAALAAAATQTFTTPPVAIAGVYPHTPVRTTSAIAVRFDQDIDPDAIAARLTAEDARPHGRPIRVHAITRAEAERRWAENPSLQFDAARAAQILGEHVVLLAPDGEWPAGASVRVTLAPGAPSREGPRLSTAPSVGRFDVAAPMRVRGVTCGTWGPGPDEPKMAGERCPANGYVTVQLSNPIAEATYRASDIQIAGEPFDDHRPAGATVTLVAPTVIGRTYRIEVGGAIADIYGQPLEGARGISFVASQEIYSPDLAATTGLQILDPRSTIPQWVVTATAVSAVRVQLYQVQPKDYFAYEEFEADPRRAPPGRRVFDHTYPVGPRHGLRDRVDLRPALSAASTGHVIAIATAAPVGPLPPDAPPLRAIAWFQVTALGAVGRVDNGVANVWVRDLAPARFLAPTADVTATVITDDADPAPTARTDAEGHAELALAAALSPQRAGARAAHPPAHPTTALVAVTTPTDSAFLALSGDGHQIVRESDALWYATDDRFTYKPGETVYVKGWVRWTTTGANPDLALPGAGDAIAYTLRDGGGNEIARGTTTVTDQGGFDLAVALPRTANLGYAQLRLETRGKVHTLPISIQEFRTPAFSVALTDDVTHAGAAPLILGERIEMRAEAAYYAGGGLPGAGIRWDARLAPTTFQPPGWDLFTFTPPADRPDRGRRYSPLRAITATQDGALSGASMAGATFGIAALPGGVPAVLTVDSTVTDVDRMAIRASSRPILVHPSATYVGLHLDPDDADQIEVIVTDIDGAPIAGVPVAVELEAVLGSERYRSDAKVTDTQRCDLTSAGAAVRCHFQRRNIDYVYTATARVADARGRVNRAQYAVPWLSWHKDEPLRLTPDRVSYRPGDVAKIALHSDVVPATALVTFARNGAFAQKRIELAAADSVVELPITPAFIPAVHVDVDRIARRRHMAPDQTSPDPLPEMVSADVELPVDIESARLVMTAKATAKVVEPGAPATFEVTVQRNGAPVADAEVALMVVDEAVLALSSRTHEDPLPGFYRSFGDGTSAVSNLDLVQDMGAELAGAPGVDRYLLPPGHGLSGSGYGYGAGSLGGAGMGTIGHGSGVGIVTSRKDFRANAVFSPHLHTDRTGRVSLTVKMPDSLTRFRIVALATASTRYFGKAEGTVITQRKVNARAVAPRFLTQGDAFELPIVVQNLDAAPRTIDVAVRGVNLAGAGPAAQRVTVEAGQRAELRFAFRAQDRGTAAVQSIAVAGDFADASTVQLPVYAPATTEAFATYGVVDGPPQAEQLRVPDDIFPDVGGVEIEVASSQLQSLTDAFGYLYAYPYECAEQRSARMLATQAMADVLDAFATPGRPPRAEIDAQLARDQKVLIRDQRQDGGWGYWPESPEDPYVTQQVLLALVGQRVTGDARDRAMRYVRADARARTARLEARFAQPPATRDPRVDVRQDLAMVAADWTTLAAAGQDARPAARRLDVLARGLGDYPVDVRARVLAIVAGNAPDAALRGKLLSELLSATHETAAAATVTTSFVDAERMLLVSSTKSTALALDAIMREAPAHALVPKLARGLLEARRRGRWTTTAENLAVLRVMRRYFDTYESVTPAFTGKLWLGDAGYAERAFAGRSLERAQVQVGWPALPVGSTQDLAFVKDGAGRMYYRVGITYAPKRIDLPPLDAGFVVHRTYAAVDEPGDVTRDPQGRWHIKLGARVLVRVEALNTTRRYDVALVDPIPAGLEPVNTALAVAERAVPGTTSADFGHLNMRDERAEAFTSSLAEGTHVFAYSARATTPGTFVAAPAKAEEMYAPETFGRSAGATVIVE